MIDIRVRKKQLKDDLDLLEDGFQNRYSKAKGNFLGAMKPLEIVKKNPVKAVGVAFVAGLAAGLAKPKRSSNKNDSSGTSSSGSGFTSLMFDELKRLAARRTAQYVTELIDNKITSDD